MCWWILPPENCAGNVFPIILKDCRLDLIKTKCFLCGCNHPLDQSNQYFFENIGKVL